MKRGIMALVTLMMIWWMAPAASAIEFNVGPKVEERAVLVQPGNPFVILENRKLKGAWYEWKGDRIEKATKFITQDAGGWVCMPVPHFEALMRRLDNRDRVIDIRAPPVLTEGESQAFRDASGDMRAALVKLMERNEELAKAIARHNAAVTGPKPR